MNRLEVFQFLHDNQLELLTRFKSSLIKLSYSDEAADVLVREFHLTSTFQIGGLNVQTDVMVKSNGPFHSDASALRVYFNLLRIGETEFVNCFKQIIGLNIIETVRTIDNILNASLSPEKGGEHDS